MKISRIALLLAMLGSGRLARADDLFTKVEPLLKDRCFKCHSHESGKMKGGLTLDSKSGWEEGGDDGPAIVPGKPDESLLIKMIRWLDADHQMPPKEKLADAEIALLTEWVKLGAADPRTSIVKPVAAPTAETWWSLRPLVKSEVLAIEKETLPNPIDHFIRTRLAGRKIAPSPEADRRTLIRRLTFDLHGLPPSLEEVAAFENDTSPEAYENLVERLLASPRYGERWARHWLDTIHFAETHGCGHDLPRLHAWRYRDYVIDSLNRDTPWPRFVREQLAADRFYPDEPRLTPALGFLGAGVFDHSAYQTAPTNFDYLDRDDLVTQTMGAFTSTTANCARCHAHKFDPITQEDYYSLQAVFAGLIEGNVAYDADANVARQRKRWQTLLAATEPPNKAVLLSPESEAAVNEWQKNPGPEPKWKTLDYETFLAIDGSALRRMGDDLVSYTARPDKDTYVVTGTTPLESITAIRLDVLTDKLFPKNGPGVEANGDFTLSELEIRVLAPGADRPLVQKVMRVTADFDQEGYGAAAAVDGNTATGWGIYPASGAPHQAVFELRDTVPLKPGARLIFTLKQHSGKSHLIGRFKISLTQETLPHAAAMPSLATEALKLPATERTEGQRLALAAYALRIRADDALRALPPQSLVYAAAPKADVLLAVLADGGGTPTAVGLPKKVSILKRGDFDKPLAEAKPGAIAAITPLKARFALKDAKDEAEGRAALADWIADEQNPLTWRSIANRVWHYHFGRGLCDTPNDFGRMGGLPSHPELLDWLACELRESGGSLKHLHRLIVTSAAYRQVSESREDAAKLDGENRLLWRMNRLRLDADSYRDFVLATTGDLDLKMGGPSVQQFKTGPPVQLTPTLDYLAYDWAALPKHRRSIYRFVWRGVPDPFMDALDFPDLGLLAPTRGFSASSLQSLALYNNPFVLHFSEEMARKTSNPAEVARCILLREPNPDEVTAFTAYTQQYGLAALCRVLFNSNEFLFVN